MLLCKFQQRVTLIEEAKKRTVSRCTKGGASWSVGVRTVDGAGSAADLHKGISECSDHDALAVVDPEGPVLPSQDVSYFCVFT